MTISLIIAIASMVLAALSFFYLRWYIGKKVAAESFIAEQQAEVQKLLADLDFFTDRDTQLVEERITTLKKLLEDTDKRIAVYVKELERSHAGEALYTNLGRKIRSVSTLNAVPPVPAEPVLPFPPVVSDAAPSKKTENPAPPPKAEIPATPNQTEVPASPQKAAPAPPAEKQLLRVQIAELAAQGIAPSQIASRLKISLTEVDIALSLLNRR